MSQVPESEMRNAPAKVLLRTAEEIVQEKTVHSVLFRKNNESKLPVFSLDELQLGRIIGRGGFCTVHEIQAIKIDGKFDKLSSWMASKISGSKRGFVSRARDHAIHDASLHGDTEMTEKEYMSNRAFQGGQARYVIKNVAEEWIFQNRVTFLKGTVDLAIETKFLSNLRHPNIMELRGVAEGGPFQEKYFIVMDKMVETLPKMMKQWTTRDRQCKGITGAFAGAKKKLSHVTDRMTAAFDIANAIGYLHSLGVVYRDLKPDNIGFDARGVVKIFDFGLAKELREDEREASGLYRLTGFTGSIRYMAPEVGLNKPYNETADVYSFSMLLWYILALEPPYGFYTPEMFVPRVFQQGHRPVTLPEWPEQIQIMMKRSWDKRINVRPSFRIIMQVIKKETGKLDGMVAARMLPFTS